MILKQDLPRKKTHGEHGETFSVFSVGLLPWLFFSNGRCLKTFVLLIGILVSANASLRAETDWSFWAANETSYLSPRNDSLLSPGQLFRPEKWNEGLLANGRISWKPGGSRIRFQAAAAQKLDHAGRTNTRFVLREAFAVLTLNENLDLSIGKKLVNWGTGTGYSPTGFADPPKDAQDPNDRLDLNQGTELVQLNFVRGNHSIDFLYFAPRLFVTQEPILERDRLAFRYNRLWRGLDLSIMGLIASGDSNKIGANYSYVLGRSIEAHGELAFLFPSGSREKKDLPATIPEAGTGAQGERNMLTQSLLGGSYTFRSGWTLTGEWHHDGEGLNSAGNRQNKDTLFLMAGFPWGNQKYSVQWVALRNIQDSSIALIPAFNAQLHRNWQVYLRPSFFMGKPESQYGRLLIKMVLTMGLRYNL